MTNEEPGASGHHSSGSDDGGQPRPVRIVVLLILGVLLATGLAAWYLRGSSETDAAERLSPFSQVSAPLSHIPGQEQRRYSTELSSKLERLDPSVDGWDSEVISAAIHERLHGLQEILGHAGKRTEQALASFIEPDYEGSALRPHGLDVVYDRGGLTVSRPADLGDGRTFSGPAGFAQAASELFAPFRADEHVRIDLKLFHITPSGAGIATQVDFQASGASDRGRIQQNAIWQLRWTRPAGDELPLLAALSIEEFEEIDGPADGSPRFADHTSSVLGGDPSYAAQLVPGQAHWGSALDVSFGEQLLGHHGLAIGDVNGDGLDDLYVAQGGGLPNRLFVQQADGRAQDFAREAGVDYLEPTTSVLILDFDNDGDQDLVSASGPLVFHSNDGKGRFEIETVVPTSPVYTMAAADYDDDGDLDLYACKYGLPERRPPTPFHDANNGTPNLMLRNDGEWRFTDVTRETGLDRNNRRYSLAAAWVDYDDDGDQDLYVANDFGRNNLYRNDGGSFSDVASGAGVEDISAGSSVSWGDYNSDGRMDLYVGNIWSSAGNRTTHQRRFKEDARETVVGHYQRYARGNSLFENSGDGSFRDVSVAAGVTMGRWAWGSKFVDANNDGLEDIFVVNGYVTNDDAHDLSSFFWRQVVSQSPNDDSDPSSSYGEGWTAIYESIRGGKSWSGRERHNLFLNTGGSKFADVSAVAGLDLEDDGRGLAVVDWDLDGALDFWTSNRTGPQVRFFRNLDGADHHFVALRLEGRGSNRDAIGARVELQRPSGPPLVRTLQAGDAYLAQSSKWIHFGLGDETGVNRIVVRWPGGDSEEFRGVAADRRYRLVQGTGAAVECEARGEVDLTPASEIPQPPRGAVRTYLAARLPMRGLEFIDVTGSRVPIASEDARPLLITLWASWCEHCRHELTEIQARRGRVERSGLDILALSVDEGSERANADRFLDSLDWSFERGFAEAPLLDVLQILRQSIVDLPGGLVLPTSFLVDGWQQLAAIYRGPVEVETLLSDVESIDLEPARRLDRALPFSGRWNGPAPVGRSTEVLANLLRSRGHTEIASICRAGTETPGTAPDGRRERRADPFEYLGRSLAADGKQTEATVAYAKGLEIDPMRGSLHHAMARSLAELKRLDAAIKYLQNTIRLDAQNGDAHVDLGSIFAQLGRLDDAAEESILAAELSQPGTGTHCRALYNLGVVREAQGRPDEALELVRRALAEKPDFLDALRLFGWLHQKRGEVTAAIEIFDKVLEQNPGDPRALYLLGLAHVQAGDLPAARRDHAALVELDRAAAGQLLQRIEGGGP